MMEWLRMNAYGRKFLFRVALLFVFLINRPFAEAQSDTSGNKIDPKTDSISLRIILVGDAGKQDNNRHPELELARRLFPMDKKTVVLYLGDNIYPQGLPSVYEKNYEAMKQILDSQINIVRGTEAKAYFIPGNHDWMQGRSGGYQQMVNQYNYITSLQLPNVLAVPDDVCPGPQEIPLSPKVTLVVIDSQWWLHKYEKPSVTYGCDYQTEDEMLDALREIVIRNEGKLLVFAAHHPFITYGRHGGYYTFKQHIFPFTEINPKLYIPLPILGSIYPISRGVFGNIQDLRHPTYKDFSRAVDSVLNEHPYCIRVAGHEHSLQFIKQSEHFYVVSGAGSKYGDLAKGEDLVFGASQTGFGVLEVIKNGNVRMSFYSTKRDTAILPIYATNLPALDTTIPKAKVYEIPKLKDSVFIAANTRYKAGGFKRWLLGGNYRKEWITPVPAKVFDISKEMGGLKITKRGGGMQTKSLTLEDKNGNEYALRSVEKFPDNTLPEEFRQTFVKDAVVDGISASYPFAALSVPALSTAAGVPHAKPQVRYIPDDPRLGYYRGDFANTLAIFESREPGNFKKNSSTEKVLQRMRDDHDNMIDQRAVLRARLLDMFIMDFDRHDDQWRWATNDTGERRLYQPIPRDRDQAFFVNQGFIPWIIAADSRMPKFQGFRAKARNINTFNFNARYFDRTFLNEVTRAEWEALSDSLIARMTDTIISEAIKNQPEQIYQFSGPTIENKLRDRRNYMKKEAVKYYKFLAKEVNITGSNKREFFDIQRMEDGAVNVTMRKINKEGDTGRVLYERKFFPDETKEIRLYGMAGEDSFQVSGSSNKKILLRLIGGRDKDYFINNSSASRYSNVIYDFIPEKNQVGGTGKFRNLSSNSSIVNRFDRREYKYNILAPRLAVAFNRDDGLFLGLGARYVGHGFRKAPYKILHQVSAAHALATKAFIWAYRMEAIDVFGKNDFLLETSLRMPRNTINFFGFGNETTYDLENGKDIFYYRTRFDNGQAAALLRTQLTPFMNISYGPAYQYYHLKEEDNRGRIIDAAEQHGLDTNFIFASKSYLGPLVRIVVDNRNDAVIPSRGVYWTTEFGGFKGLNKNSNDYGRFNSDLTVYMSSNTPAKLVVALRFGGGINWGNYEYYQAQYLSGTENLRGHRKWRYAGDKMLYNNIDIRYKLFEFRTYLLPGSLGLLAFHDVGRVWYNDEKSRTWHTGYGAGIWIAPAGRFVATAALSFSKDEEILPLITFGYQF